MDDVREGLLNFQEWKDPNTPFICIKSIQHGYKKSIRTFFTISEREGVRQTDRETDRQKQRDRQIEKVTETDRQGVKRG